MKISIIGCGNIGRALIKAVGDGVINCEISGLFDVNDMGLKKIPADLREKLNLNLIFTGDFSRFLDFKSDLVVEAASQEAVSDFGLRVLSSGKNLAVMSVGALVDEKLLFELKTAADKNNLKIYVPSGAIAGLDGIKAAKISGITEAVLTTRKPPGSLGIEERDCPKERVLYEGSAREAVKLFPKNINVAATLSLSGIGFEKTKVKLIADPAIKNNIHEILLKGSFGEMTLRVENVPSPDNPKTSYLASLSAIALLKSITESVQIGN